MFRCSHTNSPNDDIQLEPSVAAKSMYEFRIFLSIRILNSFFQLAEMACDVEVFCDTLHGPRCLKQRCKFRSCSHACTALVGLSRLQLHPQPTSIKPALFSLFYTFNVVVFYKYNSFSFGPSCVDHCDVLQECGEATTEREAYNGTCKLRSFRLYPSRFYHLFLHNVRPH